MAATRTVSSAPLGDPDLARDYAAIAPRLAAYYLAAAAEGAGEWADRLAAAWTTIALNVGADLADYEARQPGRRR
ncbi:MAG: hypothetical protein ACXV3F_12110 [Frankiaceae bacterium]